MNHRKGKKGLITYAVILTALIFATPIVAGVLNSFVAGETISSSAVNENFAMLNDDLQGVQDQINEICLLPGQIIFAGYIEQTNLGPQFLSEPFTCSDLEVSLGSSFDAGAFRLNLVGIETSEAIPMVVPNKKGAFTLACNANPENPAFFTFYCHVALDDSIPNPPNQPRYFVTLIRK